MAATTRKRKSTRSPTKSKKAKGEEEATSPTDEVAADEKEENPPAEASNGTDYPVTDADDDNITSTVDTPVIHADSKDAHEAAEALLAVGGFDAKAVENQSDPHPSSQPGTLLSYEKSDAVEQANHTAKDEPPAMPNVAVNCKTDDGLKHEIDNPSPTNDSNPPSNERDEAPQVKTENTFLNASTPTGAPTSSMNPGVSHNSESATSTSVAPPGVPSAHTTPVPVAAPALAESSEPTIEENGEVSMLYVGRVIGKGGEMIRDLQARSGCRIDVDQNVPEGAPRIITYKGTRSTIDFAKQLVAILCTEGGSEADLPLGRAIKKLVLVPATVIGKIIGRGGEMIRELQSKSTAKIQVDHTAMGEMRHINVTGTEQSVLKAEEMIQFLAANPAVDAHEAIAMLIREKTVTGAAWGSGPPYPNLPNQGQGMPASNEMGSGMFGGGGYGQPQQAVYSGGYGAQQPSPYGQPFSTGIGGIVTDMFPCPKMYMGRVIGQKGVTINDLQKRSGCDIQINQNVPVGQDCEICIKGSMQGIQMAKQMLHEIIEMGPNHPYAGGHGQQGGGRGHYAGQQGGYQQQQPFQQGGYANQGYQPQSYPAQQQYGMQQPYGGQPIYQQQPYQPPPPMYGNQPGMPMPPAQASPWRSATAADGQIYYYNQNTGETQWDKPPGMP